MVERLNFYDVYGYLIPGLVFVGLLWLPFALENETFLRLDWSSALLVLVLAYITGHIIQGLVMSALPSTKRDKGNRYPSDFLLDGDDTTLSPEVRDRITLRVAIKFGLDVKDPVRPEDRPAVSKRRSDGFLMCRRALIQDGLASYAEQFEGMYALMRGLSGACILGLGYYIGLFIRYLARDVLNISIPSAFTVGAVLMTFLALLLAVLAVCSASRRKNIQALLFWLTVFLLLMLATLLPPDVDAASAPSFLVLVSVILVFVALRCYTAYDEYSRLFAATVYRDFGALKLS